MACTQFASVHTQSVDTHNYCFTFDVLGSTKSFYTGVASAALCSKRVPRLMGFPQDVNRNDGERTQRSLHWIYILNLVSLSPWPAH